MLLGARLYGMSLRGLTRGHFIMPDDLSELVKTPDLFVDAELHKMTEMTPRRA